MNKYPTEAELKKIHEETSYGNYKEHYVNLIWIHSQIVKEVALLIIDKLEKDGISVNRDQVITGALMHDVGVYLCFDEDLNPKGKPYISHSIIGNDIILKHGLGQEIARYALVHTGTGITIQDIEREDLPLPKGDYIPITLEEAIVTYADKFHTKYPKFTTFEESKNKLSKFDPTKGIKMDIFKKKFGIPEIKTIKEKYSRWHIEYEELISNVGNKNL